MMGFETWHSWHWRLAFGLTLAFSAYCLLAMPGLSEQCIWLLLFAGLIGVPHGLTDLLILPALAKRFGVARHNPLWDRLAGGAIYLALIGFYALLWRQSPLLALIGFLLMAGWHFGEQDIGTYHQRLRYPTLQGALRGLAVIALPYLTQDETAQYFAILSETAIWHHNYPAAWPLGLASVVIAGAVFSGNRYYLSETLLLMLMLSLLPPLLSFTCYFCLWHTPRHYLRVTPSLSARSLRVLCAGTGLSLVLIAIIWVVVSDWQWLLTGGEAQIIQAFFMPLAALTFAHVCAHTLVSCPFGHRDKPALV